MKLKRFDDINNIDKLNESYYIQKLKQIDQASLKDLVKGKNLVWYMKKSIIELHEKIKELDFKIAELRGEVEED